MRLSETHLRILDPTFSPALQGDLFTAAGLVDLLLPAAAAGQGEGRVLLFWFIVPCLDLFPPLCQYSRVCSRPVRRCHAGQPHACWEVVILRLRRGREDILRGWG